jgi:hypothetical protein
LGDGGNDAQCPPPTRRAALHVEGKDEIHEHGFLLLGGVVFQNFARNPVLVNPPLRAPGYGPQQLASNLAKSPL